MKVPMGPPPLPTSNPSSSGDTEPKSPPPAPPPDEPLPEEPSSSDEPPAPLPDSDNEKLENTNEVPKSNANASVPRSSSKSVRAQVPYTIPEWSEAPDQPFFFEVLKEGSIVEKLDVSKKGAYMFGRSELCDFVLEHPTLSRFHAVLQFRGGAEVFLFDLGSTHGTFINKNQVGKKEYTEIHVGDVVKFGMSTRLYIFQGPSDLMPPEGDLNKIREAKAAREDMRDREESLARARREASLAEGISWGMAEDAIEETPDVDVDEITWQTYKGLLTERQEKTKSKIVKRIEKVAHMKKEIDAIRAKDISQGGLTQGQQTQIARNELRITQLMEELENLEETLNESIRESVGARTGKGAHFKKKGDFEEEDDGVISDDDDFYDRTKKKKKSSNGEEQTVETADSLLDKRDLIINEMDMKRKLLESEKNRLASTGGSKIEDGDDLDAYMTGLSSQLVHEKVTQFEEELADLQVELEKITYLLKIADPMGDAAKKRELTKSSQPAPSEKGPFKEPQKPTASKTFKEPKKPASTTQFKEPKKPDVTPVKESKEPSNLVKEEPVNPPKEIEHEAKEKPKFALPKPQWLGAVRISTESEANEVQLESTETEETDGFVDYKDRKEILLPQSGINEIEAAKPGLIVRKRKEPARSEDSGSDNKDTKAPKTEPESSVADAVALLLKHERGYQALDELEDGGKMEHKSKKEKRVLGPSRPDFLESTDYETWVPPEGQTGDGRTKLNDRFGY